MKITELKPTRRDGRINVYLDGEYSFTVFEEFIYEYSLFPENEISEELLPEIMAKDGRKYAKLKAFDHLSRGALTVSAMKKKLSDKGIANDIIEETVAYLIKNDYINDRTFAENAISVLHETKGFGKNRILQFFYEKGVPKDIATEVTEQYFEDCERPDVLGDLISELAPHYDLGDIKSRSKLIAKLTRLGYGYSEIKENLRNYTDNIDFED
ncbi:MAG: RecX family transcriptional regulator [Clostridia bacterium]|nr:RecX family transcriptional regulator [Clostridia bacterium]